MPRHDAKAEASPPERREIALPPATPLADASLKFQVEFLVDIAAELPPLLVDHHREIERDAVALDVDWDEWFRMNALGMLRILTARWEGLLVGYIFNIVRPSLHAKTVLHCTVEGFWLSPAYRVGWQPFKMFRENDRLLDEWDVKRVYVTAEYAYLGGRAREIFKRLGYRCVAEVWSRMRS